PGVVAAEDQVGQEDAGDGAVRHAHARIAGGDVDVVGVHRVLADEGQPVDRLHDLAGPAVLDRPALRPALAGPRLQAGEAAGGVALLAGLVVLAADDQQVRPAAAVLEAGVVVRGTRVPGTRPSRRPCRHAQR